MQQIKVPLLILIALLVGLGAGYLLFGGTATAQETAHQHEAEATDSEGTTWTCSMHPQVRREEAGDCPICGMDLIPQSEMSSNDPLNFEMTREAARLANVQTTVVGKSAAEAGTALQLSGKVQADERRASSQVAQVPGRIEKLYVSFTGEPVYKGQKLAELYVPDLISAQRELLEAAKLQAVNPKLLEAARNKLRHWKISPEQIGQIIASGDIQETFPLHATASGVVTQRRVAVGDYVAQGEPLFDLMNLNTVWVLFDAYEEDLPQIEVGDRITFTTPAVPGRRFSGKVTFIDPVIDKDRRVVSIRTEVRNPNGKLKPEMLVTGKLQAEAAGEQVSLTVPKSAVLWTGERSVVYVKVPDTDIPTFQYRELELGEALGDRYRVLDGLEAGEEVVTYGNFSIDAAAQLNNQASMMNRDIQIKGESGAKEVPNYQAAAPQAFKQQLGSAIEAYLRLKDALVATDAETAAAKATSFTNEVEKVSSEELAGDALAYWRQQRGALIAHGKNITKSGEVSEQRTQFDFLSQTLIKTVKAFGADEQTYYVQHCPMAFDWEGADWISDVEEIRNPYFGDEMLTCGTVEETLAVE
ncbi:MAG: efflux RND transporter periplasmic adaptor subunit [Bacteroidetes bacterium]|jgi:Cu(I)/Ag(I) efflux system membrane fusion protein|nr:efflux RND transporter periplasmic adaptor subunit [Bacteroidota bacterium]